MRKAGSQAAPMAEADPPPPPPPRPRAPPPLPDELVEEILLRYPPDDPARLVRAALVCKRWARVVSARAFRRRFRDFHLQRRRVAPMLGFFHYVCGAREAYFVRTSASCPPLRIQRGWLALDARGGRVLLSERGDAASPGSPGIGLRLAVWDPLFAAAGGHLELPVLVLPRGARFWNAALVCCDQNGLQADHAGGSFRVVLVSTDPERGIFACVYSSFGPAAWSEPIYTAQQHPGTAGGAGFRYANVDRTRAALVRNALYFLFMGRAWTILKYDLATGDMSVIRMPPPPDPERMSGIVLTTTEDGGLGFARVEGYKLCLWSMESRPNGCGALAMEWTRCKVIDLGSLLPVNDLLGYADGVGMIFVGTIDGFFSIDQKSGCIDKLVGSPGFYDDVVP